MNLYQVIPGPPREIPFSTPEQRDALRPELRPPGTPWIRAVMVTNPRGETVDQAGSSRGLTRGADRALLALYRDISSVVIVGAQTIRQEPVPPPRHTPLVVVSSSGDLRGHQLIRREGSRVLVATSESGARTFRAEPSISGVELVTIPGGGPFLASEILAALSGRVDTDSVLVEGGEALWRCFAPVTDELCLATTGPPRDAHAGVPHWWPRSPETLTLHSLMTDDSQMLYYRYRSAPGGAPPGAQPGADLS